jgi:hypothetical protein
MEPLLWMIPFSASIVCISVSRSRYS